MSGNDCCADALRAAKVTEGFGLHRCPLPGGYFHTLALERAP